MTTNTSDPLPGFEGPPTGAAPSAVERRRRKFDLEPMAWIDIHPDGAETPRTGFVWVQAPAVPGRGRGAWVIPDGESTPTLVITVGTRHRVGRWITTNPTRWRADGGRFVDKGERYRETHPFARRYWPTAPGPRRSISGAPTTAVDRTELENFHAVIDQMITDRKETER